MTKAWKTYAVVVGTIAVCLFAWVMLNGWFEMVGDGHGPDAGSQEAISSQARNRQKAPLRATVAVVYWLAISVGIAGLVVAARKALRLVSVRDSNVR